MNTASVMFDFYLWEQQALNKLSHIVEEFRSRLHLLRRKLGTSVCPWG